MNGNFQEQGKENEMHKGCINSFSRVYNQSKILKTK